MKKWFISDTHFSHTNIIRYTGRPFETVEEMNLCLIKNWNDCIDADDQVFFLGDFGLGDVFLYDLISHQIRNSFDVLDDKNVSTFQLLHAFLSLTNLAKSVDHWWTK